MVFNNASSHIKHDISQVKNEGIALATQVGVVCSFNSDQDAIPSISETRGCKVLILVWTWSMCSAERARFARMFGQPTEVHDQGMVPRSQLLILDLFILSSERSVRGKLPHLGSTCLRIFWTWQCTSLLFSPSPPPLDTFPSKRTKLTIIDNPKHTNPPSFPFLSDEICTWRYWSKMCGSPTRVPTKMLWYFICCRCTVYHCQLPCISGLCGY